MGKSRKLGLILITLAALPAITNAQLAIPRTIESIDLTAIRSKSIIIGRIIKIEQSPDSKYGYSCDVTFTVELTLKGVKTNQLVAHLGGSAATYEHFREKASRLLIGFPEKFNGSTIIDLDERPFVISRSDFSVLNDSKSLIKIAKDLIAKNPEGADTRFEHIYPSDTPAEKAWKKALGDRDFIQLTVPIDQALEKIAWERMKSKDPYQQSEAARYLSYFKSPENIAKLKLLLNSPNTTVWPIDEEAVGMSDRHYFTRDIAYELLKKWEISVPVPVLHVSESIIGELKVVHIYKPITTEILIKLQDAKKLDDLDIGGFAITTEQMALVGRLNSVKKLNLTRLKTNDEGIAQLTTLSHLQSLNLSGLAVTDRCIESIAQMKSLTDVNLEMTLVTGKGLDSLRKARPDLKVYPDKPISVLLLNVINNDMAALRQTLDREPWAINDRYAGNKGMTALHEAVELNRVDMAKVLLDHGAKTEIMDDSGATPLETELAFYNPQDNMIRLLLGHGASLDHKLKSGKSIVSSIQGDWFDAHYFGTRLLLQCGANATEMLEAFKSNRTYKSPAGGNAVKLITDAIEERKNPIQIIPHSSANCTQVAYQLDYNNLKPWANVSFHGLNGPIQTNESPSGRQYLGPFAQQTVTLTTENLKSHKNVHVTIELFIIGSWDGNGALGAGPDILDIQVPNIGTLMHSTFFNNTEGDAALLKLQSFPDPYQLGFHTGYTGATGVKSLGFTDVWDGITNHRDAVYKLDYTFAHTGPNIQLTLNGLTHLEGGITTLTGDENWGIGSLVISTD